MRKVTRTTLPGWRSAESVVARFASSGDVAWFDAGVDADAPGSSPRPGHPRRSLVGWGDGVLTASVSDEGSVERALRLLAGEGAEADTGAEDASAEDAQDPEPLGWWGVLGYGAGAELLTPRDASRARVLQDPAGPDLLFLDVDRALVFDHDAGTVQLVTAGHHDAWARSVEGWWREAPVVPAVGADSPLQPPQPVREAEWRDSEREYLGLVDRCQRAIRDGDAFVLCLTTSVTVRRITETDLDLYARLRRTSPAPRACFLRIEGTAILCASPETFVTVDPAGVASTSPIKGTRPRGSDPGSDALIAAELGGNAKERAENLMIVDLMRNDLSRVAVPGGVEVADLFEVRSYEHVHQLVSTVTARLRPGLGAVDVVRAAFPPGSMTGAPKHSAVSLLASWETGPRGVYSGAVGRIARDGSADLAVVIRTIVLDTATGTATVGVGGGITAASVPAEEVAEIRTKAEALLRVLGAAEADPAFGSPRDVSLL